MEKTIHRNIHLTAAALSLLMLEHKQTCKVCKKKRMCLEGRSLQLDLEKRIELERFKPRSTPAPRAETSFGPYFNPSCRHDRTSYDIAHCDKCLEFTKNMLGDDT